MQGTIECYKTGTDLHPEDIIAFDNLAFYELAMKKLKLNPDRIELKQLDDGMSRGYTCGHEYDSVIISIE